MFSGILTMRRTVDYRIVHTEGHQVRVALYYNNQIIEPTHSNCIVIPGRV